MLIGVDKGVPVELIATALSLAEAALPFFQYNVPFAFVPVTFA